MLAGVGHVLAEHQDPLVALHLVAQRAGDRLAEGDARTLGPGVALLHRRKGPHVLEHGGRVGSGRSQHRAGRLGHLGRGLSPDRLCLLLGEHTAGYERRLQPGDGVVRQLVRELCRRAVLGLGVRCRVRVGPRDLGMDQRRPDAGPDVGHRLGAQPSGLEVVGAVPPPDLEAAEARHQVADRGRRLVRAGDADGVAVVGHHEQDGQVERAGAVERLPELALAGGALAERHVGDLVAVGGRRRGVQVGAARQVAGRLGAAHGREALAAGGR